jgi:hypothetical protein
MEAAGFSRPAGLRSAMSGTNPGSSGLSPVSSVADILGVQEKLTEAVWKRACVIA